MVPHTRAVDATPPPGAVMAAARLHLAEIRADLDATQAALTLAERARLDAELTIDVGYGPPLRLATLGRSGASQARLIAFLRAEAAEMLALEPHLAALVEG